MPNLNDAIKADYTALSSQLTPFESLLPGTVNHVVACHWDYAESADALTLQQLTDDRILYIADKLEPWCAPWCSEEYLYLIEFTVTAPRVCLNQTIEFEGSSIFLPNGEFCSMGREDSIFYTPDPDMEGIAGYVRQGALRYPKQQVTKITHVPVTEALLEYLDQRLLKCRATPP